MLTDLLEMLEVRKSQTEIYDRLKGKVTSSRVAGALTILTELGLLTTEVKKPYFYSQKSELGKKFHKLLKEGYKPEEILRKGVERF